MTHETDTMIFREIATECIPCKVVDDIGNGLKTIQLTPDGDVKSLKGGFVIDEESAALIIKAFDEHDTEAVIDFEHQSLGGDYSPPSGLAPAAGWITKVFYEKGRGLFGQVRWNERARDFIRSGEYKYISPVLHVRKSDRRAVELHSAALTNVPAISGMEAVAASQRQSHKETGIMENGNPVETERLIGEMRAALTDAGVEIENVDDTAGILRAAIAAIKGKVGDKAEGDGSDSRAADSEAIASSVPPSRLGLADDASTNEVLLTLSMIDPSQTKQLQSQLSTMQQSQSDQRAKELVEKYVLTNRINPNDKDQIATALAFARENPTRFEQIMGSTQPLVPHSKTTPPSATTTRRDQVIGKASREFADEEGLQKITDQTAHVNCALREHSMAKLTEDELTTLSV